MTTKKIEENTTKIEENTTTVKHTTVVEERFDAVTIVTSEEYKQYRDLLHSQLEEGRLYTRSEIKKLIDKALNKPVKKDIVE